MPPKKSASTVSPKKTRSKARSTSRSRSRGRSPGRSKKSTKTETKVEEKDETTKQVKSRKRASSSRERKSVERTRTSARLDKIRNDEKNEVKEEVSSTTTEASLRKRKSEKVPVEEKVFTRGIKSQKDASDSIDRSFSKNWLSVILAIFEPFILIFTVIFVYAGCEKKYFWKDQKFNFPHFNLRWKYDFRIPFYYSIFILYNVMLYYMPIGQKYEVKIANEIRQHRLNGLWQQIFNILIILAVFGLKQPITFLITREYLFALMITGLSFSFIIGFITYLATIKLPGENIILDIIKGKLISPRCLGLDWKIFCFFRVGLNFWITLTLLYSLDNYQTSKINKGLISITVMQILYCLTYNLEEKTIFHSSDVQKTPFGLFMSIASFFYVPFAHSVQAYYVWKHKVIVRDEYLIAASLIFAFGIYILFSSNKQKQKFRDDPFHPDVAHLDSILSPTGRRILVSGWWGFVRRPNYLGDIMTAIAFSIPCGCNSPFPWIYAIMTTLILTLRIKEDEKGCKERHKKAWDSYTERVPYRLIPYVF
ncbi:DgyrCDS2313 [Dimorphilus gyrociliatus]|uniref:DgyrCDS2313 n=1 Tax=Dimorphilus gyrociliatus TaxID=2664684 RepID=A0A7I8VF13_9ANNE|nr:DgyrCDS2313 [Dimorphilus gyrociliatus]